MGKENRFFAIIDVHGDHRLVKGKTRKKLRTRVNMVLEKDEESYPNADFRIGIIPLRDRRFKMKFPKPKKVGSQTIS